MPQTEELVNYDFAAWRLRLGLSRADAAEALDVSKSFYWVLENTGKGRKLYAWAAYGIECHARQNNLVAAQGGK